MPIQHPSIEDAMPCETHHCMSQLMLRGADKTMKGHRSKPHLAFSAFLAALMSLKYWVIAFAASLCSLIVTAGFDLHSVTGAQIQQPSSPHEEVHLLLPVLLHPILHPLPSMNEKPTSACSSGRTLQSGLHCGLLCSLAQLLLLPPLASSASSWTRWQHVAPSSA